jgi:stage V sporulation protein G
MNKGSWGKIRAFFDIATDEGFIIKGFKLIEGINGMFVGFPSQKGQDNEYYDTVYADKVLKDNLSQIAITAYGQEAAMPSSPTNAGFTPPPAPTESSMPPAEAYNDDDIPF